MTKNTILAVALSFIFLIIWYSLIPQPTPKTKKMEAVTVKEPLKTEPEKLNEITAGNKRIYINEKGVIRKIAIEEKNTITFFFDGEFFKPEATFTSKTQTFNYDNENLKFKYDFYPETFTITYTAKKDYIVELSTHLLPAGYRTTKTERFYIENKKLIRKNEFITNSPSGIQNNYFIISSIHPIHTSFTNTFAKMSINKGTYAITFYYGERKFDNLSKYNIESAIHYGGINFIGRIIFNGLNFVYNIIRNWGWSLIVMTVFIHILFLPLSIRSYKLQIRLKKLQPKIKLLQEKYKNDAKKLASEMKELYASEGVNPFGGCLPLLFQIPIFWALYSVLTNTYELRNAGWILFINDLSMHDKYYILPVLMGIIMFLQGYSQAPKEDPQQKQLAIFMPVIFTVMFLKAPSGLVLYWLTNSLISFIEFKILSKKLA